MKSYFEKNYNVWFYALVTALLFVAVMVSQDSYWRGMFIFQAIIGLVITIRVIQSQSWSGPVIIINEEGITDNRGYGLILWPDIDSLQIKKSGLSSRFINVKVQDHNVYLSRLSFWNKLYCKILPAIGFSVLTLNFYGLSPGLDEAWNYIKRIHPEKIV